ncbi:hypothetical protein [Ilumatobacter coccineus]|uniref:Uncharacterized protein n=1 Tax=Ilumatobacter coccineus (strain NBRC 103263 / KCTC 29153 / YM16-304) TaxID=1313172 RepID=A0A6C7E8W3_ILUCY|nr:hypothetical protein [Ilumatobacter coccineus]BAN00476.1 hypothetical protein YM304_01620 [Ilumatobacter coccineus YM16-304]
MEPTTDPTRTTTEPTTEQLLALLVEQRREIESLRRRVDGFDEHRDVPDRAPTAAATEISSSRRKMLQRLGATAAGAAIAAPLIARPVAAADGDALVAGAQNSATEATLLFGGTTQPNTSVLSVADEPKEIDIEAAIGGFATGSDVYNGVVGHTETSTTSVESGHALVAYPQTVPGKQAPRSNIWVRPLLDDPRSDTKEHTPGELVADTNGELWYCVDRGTPGEWRRISGFRTAGAFVPIAPTRVYDSRFTAEGPIRSGDQRLVSIADARDVRTGTVIDVGAIPVGVTAVAYNLAVTNTTGSGFLFIAPSGVAEVTAASLNWGVADESVNNGSTVKVDGDRLQRVFCGGNGSADFILDIVGYYE